MATRNRDQKREMKDGSFHDKQSQKLHILGISAVDTFAPTEKDATNMTSTAVFPLLRLSW